MTDDMYEVAFSGAITDGADIEQVKQAVAKLFKADEAKLKQLFSGKRIVIKKNINLAVAQKYQTALNNANAICELKNLSLPVEKIQEEIQITAVPVVEADSAPVTKAAAEPVKQADTSASRVDAPAVPNTMPLNINAEQIIDLEAGIAAVGSDLQDHKPEVADFEADLDGLSMAPVGSDIADKKEDEKIETPKTDGLSLL